MQFLLNFFFWGGGNISFNLMIMTNCKRIIFRVYNIWLEILFQHVGVNLNKLISKCAYSKTYNNDI